MHGTKPKCLQLFAKICCYRLLTKFAKVMFLHLSVILFTGGVCLSACWDSRPPGSRHPPRNRHHPPGADNPPWEQTPPPSTVHAGRYGQQSGGTHPTGMDTCLDRKIRAVMMSSLLNRISLVIIVITFETVKNVDGTQKQLFDIVALKQHDSWEAMQQIDLNLTTVIYTTDTKRANAKNANLRGPQGRAHLITLKHKHYGCNHWVERPTDFSLSRGDIEYRQNSDSRHKLPIESQQPLTPLSLQQNGYGWSCGKQSFNCVCFCHRSPPPVENHNNIY